MKLRMIASLGLLMVLSAGADSYAAIDRCYDYGMQGNHDEAIKECTKQINGEIKTENIVRSYIVRGISYKAKGQPEKAFSDFSKAIGLKPKKDDLYVLYMNRASAYSDKGQLDETVIDYSKAIEINPKSEEAYMNRGYAYLFKDQLDLAIADFNKALELNPQNNKVYTNRGAVYQRKGLFDQAIADYNKAIELNPNDVKAHYNMACLYAIKKNDQKSCLWLQQAVDHGYKNWEHMRKDSDLDNIRDAACYKKIIETGSKTAFSLRDWMAKDNKYKLQLVEAFIDVAKKDKVTMRLPAEYYVKEIDSLNKNAIKNGEESGLDNSFGITIKTIAIMDCDWDNGEDKLELAKRFMGQKIFENFKQLHPDKYKKLLQESKAGK